MPAEEELLIIEDEAPAVADRVVLEAPKVMDLVGLVPPSYQFLKGDAEELAVMLVVEPSTP